MITVHRTAQFDAWLLKLKDTKGKGRIVHRIRSAERNNFGDCRSVGQGVFEMRIHYGPGYRLYFTRQGRAAFLLLCGGAKRAQKADIRKARTLAELLKRTDRGKNQQD
jgi:putative addiction module killer protein